MLIEGDNAQPSLLAHVLAEAARYGTVTTRRIYGDWTTPQMSSWKESLHSLAVQPQQHSRAPGGRRLGSKGATVGRGDSLHPSSLSAAFGAV